MKKKYLFHFMLFGFVLFTIVHMVVHYHKEATQQYCAEAGNLNLDNWNPDKEKQIELKGGWLFYPNTLTSDPDKQTTPMIRQIPHFWEEDKALNDSPYGYATYVLNIQGLEPEENYAIDITDTVTAYTLYVNSRKIASNGTVGTDKETSVPQWKQETGIFQADENGCAKIVMEVSNFDYYRGGMWNTPVFGTVDSILNYVQTQKVVEMFLFAIFMSCALFHIGLYLVSRRNKTTLYFALACIATAAQTIMTSQRVINYFLPVYNWQAMVRLEYLSGYLMLPFYVLFLTELILTEQETHWIKRSICLYVAACCIVVAIPGHMYSSVLEIYKWFSFLLTVCFAYIIYKAIRKKHRELGTMLFAILIMLLAILRDTVVGGTVSWIPYALLIFIFCFSYITLKYFLKLVREKETLEEKVVIDPLTGLFNRNYLRAIDISTIMAKSDTAAYVIFLDLDDFKVINDTYGHKTGDYILKEVGKRFSQYFGSDDIICRYGGDEFVCIAFAENLERIEQTAKTIITEISRPFEKEGKSYHIGVSIGICPQNKKFKNMSAYIKAGDEAMYQAKREGKNRCVVLYPEKSNG